MVELLMVVLSAPAGARGGALGVVFRRHFEVGAHECGESVESVSERVSGARRGFVGSKFVPPRPLWHT